MAKNKNRKLFSTDKNSALPEDAALEAFEKMNAETLAGFQAENELPTVSGQQKSVPLPLYGYYGDAFFGAKVSQELLEKEQHRYFDRGEDSYDDKIELLEKGLCDKYKIVPPTKWPNRRKDRGTSGEQLMIIGQTVNDRRHPKLWGIRQEDRTRHAYCLGPSGSGKALPHSEVILTQDGWVKMGDITLKHKIYTRKGTLTDIIDISPQGECQVWEIELADGRIIEANADHQWFVIRNNHNTRNEYVKTTKQLYDEGIRLKKGENEQGYRNSIPLCHPIQFEEKPLPIDSYLLGVLLGDGYICSKNNHVFISSGDKEIIDTVLNNIGRDKFNLVKCKQDTDTNKDYAWQLQEYRNGDWHIAKETKTKLRDLGIAVHSHDKFIPEQYKWGSEEQRRELLKGLMDTDGTAHAGRFSFSTISTQLRDDFMYIARSLGLQVRYGMDYRPDKYPNSNGICWTVAVLNNDASKIFNLSRKIKTFEEYRQDRTDCIYWPEKHEPIFYSHESNFPPDTLLPYSAGALILLNTANNYDIGIKEQFFVNIANGLTNDYPGLYFRKRHNSSGVIFAPKLDGEKLANRRPANILLQHKNNTGYCTTLKNKHIPSFYLYASLENRLSFIRGLIDAKGKIYGPRVILHCSNESLMNQIQQLIDSCGYTTKINLLNNRYGTWELTIMNPDLDIISCPSKTAKLLYVIGDNAQKRSNFNDSISIVDIRPTNRFEEMTCISVADDSESYIIDNFTVTHNSTLLHAVGVEDMWYWRGGLLMEPHGDLAMGLLRAAPPYRLHDIIYLNVLDPIASPGFNPLELPLDATDEQRQEATGSVTTLIAKHFNMDPKSMPRLAKMLTNALNALSWVPGATLLEIMDFYMNEDIRNTVLSFVPDGPQKDAMRDLGENAKTDDLATLENRISRFTTNRFMRHLFGQSHTTFDFFKLMNEGKYIICPASKGGTSDDTFLKFYGSYIVSEVYKSAVMRESIEEDDRVNFALTLDEFQNFISDDIEGILAEARKYGLQMMLANQYLAQLTNTIRPAVLQNCATKLCYNLGPEDAPAMAKAFGHGLRAEDMQSIPKYHIMAAPLIMGGNVKPFISSVFPPISLKSEVAGITANLIMEISRDKYMKPRHEIDKEIADRKERLASGNKDAIIELVTRKNH